MEFIQLKKHFNYPSNQNEIYNAYRNVTRLYIDSYLKKCQWRSVKPCKCMHGEENHFHYIQPRCRSCGCSEYKPINLKTYTNGIYKNRIYDFFWWFWRFR